MKNNQPIGVFDSGVGGLTVLDKLIEKMPNENYLYVADQRYCPYGIKTADEISQRVVKIGKFLISKGVKAIVIACNTASVFIDALKMITDIPVISVIDPTCESALNSTITNEVAVLATKTTINRGIYQQMLANHNIKAYGIICSEFVDFVERGNLADPSGLKIVKEKLNFIFNTNVDTIIHGCTHFSLLEPQMREILTEFAQKITYVGCGNPTSERLKKILFENNLLNCSDSAYNLTIYTTKDKCSTLNSMKWFTKKYDELSEINI